MTIKPNLTLLSSLFLSTILFLQACKPPQPGVYKNDQIPSGTASKLHDINTELLSALKLNDIERLENVMSPDMITDRERLSTSERISNHMKEADYSLMAEYYIVKDTTVTPKGKNAPDKHAGIIQERDLGINNFNLPYTAPTGESYIALFTPKSAPQKWLITAIYDKFSYGWKLSVLQFNPYAENGRTPAELIEQAKAQLKKKYYLDASNTASFAKNCLDPATGWKYVAEDTIIAFNALALDSVMAHYKLPLTVKLLPTQPRIWRITIERTPEGAFPNVNYISKINLLDTAALKKENEAFGKVIGNVMNGIDKDKKYIYYTIYNETPKGVMFIDHYDLKQAL